MSSLSKLDAALATALVPYEPQTKATSSTATIQTDRPGVGTKERTYFHFTNFVKKPITALWKGTLPGRIVAIFLAFIASPFLLAAFTFDILKVPFVALYRHCTDITPDVLKNPDELELAPLLLMPGTSTLKIEEVNEGQTAEQAQPVETQKPETQNAVDETEEPIVEIKNPQKEYINGLTPTVSTEKSFVQQCGQYIRKRPLITLAALTFVAAAGLSLFGSAATIATVTALKGNGNGAPICQFPLNGTQSFNTSFLADNSTAIAARNMSLNPIVFETTAVQAGPFAHLGNQVAVRPINEMVLGANSSLLEIGAPPRLELGAPQSVLAIGAPPVNTSGSLALVN